MNIILHNKFAIMVSYCGKITPRRHCKCLNYPNILLIWRLKMFRLELIYFTFYKFLKVFIFSTIIKQISVFFSLYSEYINYRCMQNILCTAGKNYIFWILWKVDLEKKWTFAMSIISFIRWNVFPENNIAAQRSKFSVQYRFIWICDSNLELWLA